MSIFEASRINGLALIIPAEVAISEVDRLEAARLETDRGHRQRGVRREVHTRGLTTGGDQAGTQRRNHRAVIGAQGEFRDNQAHPFGGASGGKQLTQTRVSRNATAE